MDTLPALISFATLAGDGTGRKALKPAVGFRTCNFRATGKPEHNLGKQRSFFSTIWLLWPEV
jgi:hypothetical protein